MNSVVQDIRYAVRTLVRSPGFTIAAVLTLALGIGANTAIFSALDRVLLRPLPVEGLDRLVVVRENLPELNLENTAVSPPEVEAMAEHVGAFDELGAHRVSSWTLTGEGEPVRLTGAQTLGGYFDVFGVRPYLGRLYGPEQSTDGPHEVVVLSYGLWQQLTGGDPSVVGRTLRLNDTAHEVIGVLPPEFGYPRDAQFYKPFPMTPQWRARSATLIMTAVGRLRPDVAPEQLPAQLASYAQMRNEEWASDERFRADFVAVPFVEYVAGTLRVVLLVLMAAVAFVLLIACANVASLQLVRATGRARELAVRTAMGAGRGRIVRQLLVENSVLAVAGGALGLALGYGALRLISRWDAAQQLALVDLRLDGPVLAFTMLVSLAAAVVFGIAPALRAARVEPQEALRESVRGTTGGVGRNRFLKGSVVVQVALAVVLLLGSGLMIRSLMRLLDTDPGFQAERVATLQVSLPGSRYPNPAARVAFWDRLLERTGALPGVDAAGVAAGVPFAGDFRDSSPFELPGRPAEPGDPERHAEARFVAGDYFRALGIPLLRGRSFGPEDGPDRPRSVVISETFVERHFPNEDPIGRRIDHYGAEATIVGVVGDVSEDELGQPEKAIAYYSYPQMPWVSSMAVVVRSAGDPAAVVGAVRGAIRELDDGLAVYEVATMRTLVDRSLGTRRLAMAALGTFAGLSLVIAMLGVYGVMSYTTSQRTKEIGIRVALGAATADVSAMVLRQGMVLVVLGVGAGLAAAAVLTRFLESILYGIGALDPVTFAAVPVALALVALLATYVPARRAATVDPMAALRE